MASKYESFVRVQIPTTAEFLKQWHLWVHGKVSKHFKRDQDRIPDSVQRTRLRLLTKDFVSRWFFKHLTDDLVETSQASYMLGGVSVAHLGGLRPVYGKRTDANALWRVSDILRFAKFDYERYFYTIQNHTIDTNKFITMLGYGDVQGGKRTVSPTDYGILESLYRQGRIKPSELTEHYCSNLISIIDHPPGICGVSGCASKHFSRGYCVAHYNRVKSNRCDECEKGKASLLSKGISLNHRWTDPSVAKAVSKLRWNDSQLTPFLRNWHNSNRIKAVPSYIMRSPDLATVDAGLLKYANMIIDNDVINYFKSISRNEEHGLDSESNADVLPMTLESDTEQTVRNNPVNDLERIEVQKDLYDIIMRASLTTDELSVITKSDLEEKSIKEISIDMDMSIAKLNKLRNSAINKMRQVALTRAS